MSNNFSFPPPPPPPPPKVSGGNTSSADLNNSHGNYRGSGDTRGFGNSRGNGIFNGRRGYFQGRASFSAPASNHTQKRNYGTAFGQKPQSRPQAPPAVPSFSAGLENLLPSKLNTQPNPQARPQSMKKSNILGLTPVKQEASDSEDDRDEEAKLAAAADGGIKFEYKGHISTLSTPTEIAAWLAERRKRYPTQAKRDAAQKEAAERKRRYEEEKTARQEVMRKVREDRNERQRAKERKGPDLGKETIKNFQKHPNDPKVEAQLRTEKLRRKLEKAERDLANAEAVVSGGTGDDRAADLKPARDKGTDVDSDGSITESSTLDDSYATSSSGSDSESDSAPEEMSSRIQQPALHQSLPMMQAPTQQVCIYFAKNRQCKFGKRCKYAHDQADAKHRALKGHQPRSSSARKGLWQVMVEKEQEEEQKRVLRAIIALGEAGKLEGPQA